MKGWDDKRIKELQAAGKIMGYTVKQKAGGATRHQKRKDKVNGNSIPAAAKRSKEKDWLGWNLMWWANENALHLDTELKFSGKRDFRFDYAFKAIKVAIEYEGLFSEKSRHTTAKGFTRDTDKYRLSALEGWTVLRYTALNYKNVLQDLGTFMQKRKNDAPVLR